MAETHVLFLASDIIGAFFMLLGTLMLIGSIKVFAGEKFRKHAVLIGAGMLLFSVLHEGGEFICLSGMHGGSPETAYGSAHIIILGSLGSVIFFIGCYMLQRRYLKYLGNGR